MTVSRPPGRDEGGNAYIARVLSFGEVDGARGGVHGGKVAKGKLACSGQTDRARQQPVQRVPTLSRDILSISCRLKSVRLCYVESRRQRSRIGDTCDPLGQRKPVCT